MKEYDLKDLLLLDPMDPKTFKLKNTINELGNQYGSLTVIGCTRLPEKKNNLYWVCQCTCGKIKCVLGGDLRNKRVVSCGHHCDKIQDLTNQHFGALRVIKKDPLPASSFSDQVTHWICECELCKTQISVSQKSLQKGLTQSCGCIKSKGEFKIRKILTEYNIPFKIEYTFDNCRFPWKNSLAKFDFYVNENYLIEYDGEQHFKDVKWFGNTSLELIKRRDEFKNQWCKENNIPLIQIPYTHYEDITINDLKLETSKFII